VVAIVLWVGSTTGTPPGSPVAGIDQSGIDKDKRPPLAVEDALIREMKF